MQNTRLNLLVVDALGRFTRFFRNPWRRLSLLVISILGGNFLATTISTVAGQRAELDVLEALTLVVFTEIISWLVYRGDQRDRRDRQSAEGSQRALILELLNGIKLGLIYGLFVEAFKLGS